MFATLGDAGIARKDLYLAWDFTVASERGLSERCCTSATTPSRSSATPTSPT